MKIQGGQVPRVMGEHWLDNVVAASLTFVRATSEQIAEVFTFAPGTQREMTFNGAEDEQDHETGQFVVQVDHFGGWTVLIEPNGYLGAAASVLCALSREGGTAVNMYWNVNDHMSFALAVDGKAVRSFDPTASDLPGIGNIGEPLLQEEGLAFGEASWDQPGGATASMLALAERLTGVTITESWLLHQPHLTWTTATG